MNRRGFFGTLFAAAVAPTVAKVLPKPTPMVRQWDPVSMTELQRRYFDPAARALAAQMEQSAVMYNHAFDRALREFEAHRSRDEAFFASDTWEGQRA